MITPCNAENGCGVITPISQNHSPATPTATMSLPFDQMTGITSTQASPMQAAQTTQMTQEAQGAQGAQTVAAADMPETIPGQPDPPLNPAAGTVRPGGNVPTPVLPEAPQFQVPNNPLLPPGYQETISYENLQYLNGFLRTQIGKYIRVEQLIGSNIIEDRYGYLIGVGINYILLQELGTGNVSALDYYNIKYIYVYYSNMGLPTNSQR